jgi:UDPglucose--hexose-1-phosphate uridylyltransferase
MRRTQNRLADGREIFYFDEDSSPKRLKSDQRDLSDVTTSQGSMRFDLLTGEWVAIAGHRQQRIFLPDILACPLCPSTPERLSEIPESDYSVVVFENRFPSFSGKIDPSQLTQHPNWGDEIPAAGRCEVVAYSPDHYGSLANLNEQEMRLVISAWIDRSRELSKLESVEYVFVFENRGAEVGVTLHHPHGQIYGYPYVPTYVKKMLEQAKSYRQIHNRSMLDDVVAKELLADERIVYQDSNWVIFVPHAARWPFEIQIHPLRNLSFLTDLNQREFDALAGFIPKVIRALDNIFESPLPYMAGWIQAPAKDTESLSDARLFMRIVSVQRAVEKLKYLAGSESLMGSWISDVLPEEAAERIRVEIQKVMS